MIVYKRLPSGGFLAGDTETGFGYWAGAQHFLAKEAQRDPEATAAEMLRHDIAFRAPGPTERDRQWMAEILAYTPYQ